MNQDQQKDLRRNLLIESYGSPDKQKNTLVSDILNAFVSPDRWPMTDTERIALIRRWHTQARTIYNTENP